MGTRGQRLCATCREELATGLRMLPWLYLECEHVQNCGTPHHAREKTAGAGALPATASSAAAAEARTEIVKVLSLWCGLVADGRQTPGSPRAVEPLAAHLARHVEWLAAHSIATEVTGGVTLLTRGGGAHTDAARTVRLGACVIPGCGGTLDVGLPVTTSSHPVRIQCSADGAHTWSAQQWTQLSRILKERASHSDARTHKERWLTAAEVARLWDTPVGTVYRLASAQRWRRRRRAGRAYYHESDVHECFSRRTAPSP